MLRVAVDVDLVAQVHELALDDDRYAELGLELSHPLAQLRELERHRAAHRSLPLRELLDDAVRVTALAAVDDDSRREHARAHQRPQTVRSHVHGDAIPLGVVRDGELTSLTRAVVLDLVELLPGELRGGLSRVRLC